MSNVVCLKHSHYRGETAPELSCKMCCSMFVARIRADQAAQLESKNIDISTMKFKPLMDESLAKPAAAPKKANFDTSWI